MDIVSRRYSEALFELAKEENKIEILLEQLELLKKVFQQNPNIYSVLGHPEVSVKEKQSSIDELFSDIFEEEICNVLKLMIEKDRLSYLDSIVDDFNELYLRYSNTVRVNVASAVELANEQKDELAAKLINMMGKDVILQYEIDKSLIGGLLIKLEDKVIDTTVKGKLELLKSELLQDAI